MTVQLTFRLNRLRQSLETLKHLKFVLSIVNCYRKLREEAETEGNRLGPMFCNHLLHIAVEEVTTTEAEYVGQ